MGMKSPKAKKEKKKGEKVEKMAGFFHTYTLKNLLKQHASYENVQVQNMTHSRKFLMFKTK